MKNLYAIVFAFLAFMPIFSTGCSTVDPGSVVVAVNVLGNNSTQDAAKESYAVIRSGRYWPMSWAWQYYTLPIREQREIWTATISEGQPSDESIWLAAFDGQQIGFDVGMSYQIHNTDDKIIEMIMQYGYDLEVTVNGRVRDVLRGSLSTCASELELKVVDIYSTGRVPLFDCAFKRTKETFEPYGLDVIRVEIVGGPHLPKSISEKMEQAQRASQEAEMVRRELEVQEAQADKLRVDSEAKAAATVTAAQAEAKANDILTQSITPEVLKLRQLEIDRIRAERWDGKMPTTIMGGDVPLIMNMGGN